MRYTLLTLMVLSLCSCGGGGAAAPDAAQPTINSLENDTVGHWAWVAGQWVWIVDRGAPPAPPSANG